MQVSERSFLVHSNLHLYVSDGEGLRFDARDSVNSLHRLQNFPFRGEVVGLPSTEGVGREGGDDLEVQATTAHDALHAAFRLECILVLIEDLLHSSEGRLVVGIGPLAPVSALASRRG